MSYLGIDLGGSKTLIAVFDGSGKIIAEKKFPTNKDYEKFILDVEKNVVDISTNTNIACSMAVPGLITRDTGLVHALGNLEWKDRPIRDDISRVLGLPVIIENDARIAALAEARLVDGEEKLLYLTISTGIGGGVVENGNIVEALIDMEVGQMPVLYEDKVQVWEKFASGHAIKQIYGLQASDIQDEKIWQEIGEKIAYGVAICCSVLQPNTIVFGGGVGQYADKFIGPINHYLADNLSPLVKKPKQLLASSYGADSAIHGCFELLKRKDLVR